jgi:hypothetical protein
MSFDAISVWESLTARLRGIGQLLPPLILRLIMGWEFWESGREKYFGDNWFTDIKDRFPFPSTRFRLTSVGRWPHISNSAAQSCWCSACSRALPRTACSC